MPEAFDVRKHGGLFTACEDEDKANEFVHLAKEVIPDIEWEVRKGVMEGAPVQVLDIGEEPKWSLWAFPKGRPGYAQAYMELGSRLGYLARMIRWPLEEYPVEVNPCEASN